MKFKIDRNLLPLSYGIPKLQMVAELILPKGSEWKVCSLPSSASGVYSTPQTFICFWCVQYTQNLHFIGALPSLHLSLYGCFYCIVIFGSQTFLIPNGLTSIQCLFGVLFLNKISLQAHRIQTWKSGFGRHCSIPYNCLPYRALALKFISINNIQLK